MNELSGAPIILTAEEIDKLKLFSTNSDAREVGKFVDEVYFSRRQSAPVDRQGDTHDLDES